MKVSSPRTALHAVVFHVIPRRRGLKGIRTIGLYYRQSEADGACAENMPAYGMQKDQMLPHAMHLLYERHLICSMIRGHTRMASSAMTACWSPDAQHMHCQRHLSGSVTHLAT